MKKEPGEAIPEEGIEKEEKEEKGKEKKEEKTEKKEKKIGRMKNKRIWNYLQKDRLTDRQRKRESNDIFGQLINTL